MGAQLSLWEYPEAKEYAGFLCKLFGGPDFGTRTRGGALIWTKSLASKSLFGQGMAFSKVTIKDERVYQSLPKPCYTYLYLFVMVPPASVQDSLACQLHNIYSGATYDFQTGTLWVRVDNLERGIALLRVLTDFLYGTVTLTNLQADNAVLNIFKGLYDVSGKAKPATIATHYAKLTSNLALLRQVAKQIKAQAPMPVVSDPSLEHGIPNLTDFETLQKLENTDVYKPEKFDNPYAGYTSNNPLTLAMEQGWDDKFYAVSRPYLGGNNKAKQVAYASQEPNAYSIEHLKIHPNCKGACAKRVVDQFDKDKKREHLRVRPSGSLDGRATYNMLSVPAAAGVSAFSDSGNMERMHVKPNGRFDGRATYNMLSVPAAAGVSSFTERMTPDPLSGNIGQRTDPRFLVGSANLYYNVGSDVMDITRLYGTVEQNQRFPMYTDAIKYGLTSVPTVPTDPLERRRLEKPPISKDFHTPESKERMTLKKNCRSCPKKREERFVSTGSEHVKDVLAEEGAGVDPFLYWTEGK